MSTLSLFSGIGALDLAVENLTGRPLAAYSENNPHAAAVMAHHFPHAVNVGDVSAADWTALAAEHPGIDTVAAGFPCQDISDTGTKEGLDGARSGLWSHVVCAIGHLRPRLVFLENVGAILRRGLPRVLGDLAGLGYDVRWTCLPASAVGACHERRRWFAAAAPHADGFRRPRGSGDFTVPTGWDEPAYLHSPARWFGEYAPAVRRWEDVLGRPAPWPGRLGPRGGWAVSFFAEWMMGLPDGWLAVDGLPDAELVVLCGNSVVPLQAFTAYRSLLAPVPARAVAAAA